MRKKLSSFFISASCLLLMSTYVKAEVILPNTAFNKIKSLQGDWVKKGDKKTGFRINFEVMAGDSIVVETWLRNDRRHSLTIYHMDNEDLIATHYCPQGNQPRLKLNRASNSGLLDFRFHDATNLVGHKGSYQSALGFEFGAEDKTIKRFETYSKDGKEQIDDLILVRKREK